MLATLTIIRYKKRFIPVAFFAMAIHRLPLSLMKDVAFYKLMGCGKNGTFDKVPDLQQWAILTVHKTATFTQEPTLQNLYGKFIARWLRLLPL